MRKKLLMKSLLVAAALCVGGNAWADVTPFSENYEGDGATCDWTSGNTGRYTTALAEADGNHYVQVSAVGNGNSGALIKGNSTNGKAASGDNYTLIFDLKITGGNNQTSWFQVNDANNYDTNINGSATPANCILLLQQTKTSGTSWKINNNESQTVTLSKTSWNRIKLTVNDGKTYLTVTDVSTGDDIMARTVITTNSTTGGLGGMQFATKRYYSAMSIDNVVVRAVQEGDLPTETYYTATFIDNTTSTDVTSGTTIYTTDERTVTVANGMLEDGKTYYFTATKTAYKNYEGSFEVDGVDPSVSFSMIAQPTYSYTVNAVDGSSNVLATLASGSSYNTASVSFAYPQFILKDGILYTKGATSQVYGTSFTLTSDDQVENVAYSTSSYANVVYYAEAESIDGMIASNSGQGDIRCSNRYGAYAGSDVDFVTLPAGTYKIRAGFCGGAGTTFSINYGESTVWSAETNGSRSEAEGSSFIVDGTTPLTIKAAGNGTVLLDNIIIQKTGEVVTIGATGYATFASDYALDFSAATGVKAYYATAAADGKVTMAEVTGTAAAGEGLFLQKTTGDIAIPVVATGDALTGNLLVRGTGAAVEAESGYNKYVLGAEGESVAFFLINATAATVAKDKAYLKVAAGTGSRLAIVFDDETTGIATVENASVLNENYYNLNGQRIVAPQKGLYIVNGKKVVMK